MTDAGNSGRLDPEAAWKIVQTRLALKRLTDGIPGQPVIDEAGIDALHQLDVAITEEQKAKSRAIGQVILEAQEIVRGEPGI